MPRKPPPKPGEEKLFTSGEVAAMLRVTSKTVAQWARTGRIAGIRATPNGQRRYRESEVSALLRDRREARLDRGEAVAISAGPRNLTTPEVAALFSVGPGAISTWARRGKFPGAVQGSNGKWLIPSDAAEALLRSDRRVKQRANGHLERDPDWKVCSDCKKKKPITQFQKHRRGAQGVQARCRLCANAAAKKWRDEHPFYSAQRTSTGYFRDTVRWNRIRERYGITEEQFHALEAAQGGRCAICGKERRLVIDHCHASGRVRGLLCNACNLVIGHLEQDGWLETAQRYLVDHPAAAALGDGVAAALEAVRRKRVTSSQYKGVFWDNTRKKWCARIRANGRVKTVGSFDSEEEAARALADAAALLKNEAVAS